MHSVTQYVSGYHVDEFVGDSEQCLRRICSLCVGVSVILYESRSNGQAIIFCSCGYFLLSLWPCGHYIFVLWFLLLSSIFFSFFLA